MFSQWLELSSDVDWVGQGRPREYEMWGPRAHSWDVFGSERRCGFACMLPPAKRRRELKDHWPNNFSPQAGPTGPLQGIPAKTGRERRGGGYVGNEAALQGQAASTARRAAHIASQTKLRTHKPPGTLEAHLHKTVLTTTSQPSRDHPDHSESGPGVRHYYK